MVTRSLRCAVGAVTLVVALAACAASSEPASPGASDADAGDVDARVSAPGDAGGEGGQADADVVPSVVVETIKGLASASACYKYSWQGRGQMPLGYLEGVALVFARAVCNPSRSDVLVVSEAKTGKDASDALSWYNSNFAAVGMTNDVAGRDTLRHAYTLLLGLGMRESSGQHCVGRDPTATNTTANSAEAGAWQTSWDSHVASAELPKLFSLYQASTSGCLLDVFSKGVTCSAANWKNWGAAGDGLTFQQLEKTCPAFAAEYAAVMLRVDGGTAGHYGPLRTKAAEIRPECDALLKQVETVVEQSPSGCAGL